MKKVALKLVPCEQKVEIETFPFIFENLLYLCIERAMESPGEDRTISITLEKRRNKVFILFTGLSMREEKENTIFPVSDEILKKLDSRIIYGDADGSFIIEVPEHLKA
jgi:hypothetical protein